jgi:hypothetical protein
MAIEFRCTQCNALLRTGDDTAGKEARCPACGTVVPIPSATAASGGSLPQPGKTPFGGVGQMSFAADSGNPYQSPSVPAPERAILPGNLDFSDVFSRTWNLFKMDWGTCLAVVVIGMGLNIAAAIVGAFVPIVGDIASFLFGIWIGIGQNMFFLKKARGQPVEIGEIFRGSPYFGKTLVVAILLNVIFLAIAALCVVPMLLIGLASGDEETTIILAVAGALIALILYCYVQLVVFQFEFLIIDRNVGIIESLTTSKSLMSGKKLMLLMIMIVYGLVGGVTALLTCGLGLFVAMPYYAMMTAVIYLIVTGQPMAEAMRPRGEGEQSHFR